MTRAAGKIASAALHTVFCDFAPHRLAFRSANRSGKIHARFQSVSRRLTDQPLGQCLSAILTLSQRFLTRSLEKLRKLSQALLATWASGLNLVRIGNALDVDVETGLRIGFLADDRTETGFATTGTVTGHDEGSLARLDVIRIARR